MPDAVTADQIESRASTQSAQTDGWRTAIVGYGTEEPEQLLAHPQNWRVHTKAQRAALSQLMDRVGWVQNVVVNRTTGHVIDGHLRVGEAIARGEHAVPVTYVELSEDDEALVLASLDPIAAMALTDSSSLLSLLSGVDLAGGPDLEALIRKTAGMGDDNLQAVTQDEIDKREQELKTAFTDGKPLQDVTCPECGHDFAVEVFKG